MSTTSRRRSPWKPLAAAVIGGSVLVTTGYGVWASLNAQAFNVTAQTNSAGTLKLTMSDAGAGFGQSIANLAPGDIVNRYVTLTNSGSLDAKNLTMKIDATGSQALITDGTSPSTTKALKVTVTSCSQAWTITTGACGGTPSQLLAGTTIGSLSSAATLHTNSTSAGAAQHLQISLQLPDQSETTVNGTLPTHTVQNQSADLTYTFAEVQRTATTTNN